MLEKPVLVGEKVVLRPITVDDAPAMYEGLFDQESMRLTGTQESFTFAQIEQYCQRVREADDRADFAITLGDDDTYIGEAVLNEIDWVNRSANYRIALANKTYFGKGYGTEATKLVIDYGLRTLDLHRIELEVFDFNPRAQHVYEKVGFVFEGIRRDVLLWEGEYHNAIVMSILKPEYLDLESA